MLVERLPLQHATSSPCRERMGAWQRGATGGECVGSSHANRHSKRTRGSRATFFAFLQKVSNAAQGGCKVMLDWFCGDAA